MKTLKEITGEQIHEEYKRQQKQEDEYSEGDDKHYIKVYIEWLEKLKEYKREDKPLPLSLNKKNYLGKKTRALISVLEIKEPKTLRELLNIIN